MSAHPLTHLKIVAHKTSPLQYAMSAMLLDVEARRLSPRTLQYYREQLEPFIDFLSDARVTTPEQITAHHIRAYLVSLQRRGLASASQHAAARAIRAFCNFMVREELLDRSPMRKVQMPKVDKQTLPAFSPADVRALLKASKFRRDSAMIYFLLDTGCRASEFLALDVGDVDFKTGTVHVRHGKGKKQRVVFLGAKARKALLQFMLERPEAAASEPLWVNLNTRERLTDSGLRQLFQRLGEQAQVANCHPHTFRRSFALWSLRAGMNIYALQQLMGHSDLTVLRRYLALVENDLREAHRKFGAIDNML